MVPSFLWSSTPLLKQLDLSSNPIRIINRDSFAGLTKLQELSLQPLPVLETIDPDSFHSLFFLTQLRMQLWPGPHLSQLLSGLRGLRRLNVEIRGPVLSSHLNYIATLETAPKLKEIEISGKPISWLHVLLQVKNLDSSNGLSASGMFIINPPWKLKDSLEETMPILTDALAQDDGAQFIIESYIP